MILFLVYYVYRWKQVKMYRFLFFSQIYINHPAILVLINVVAFLLHLFNKKKYIYFIVLLLFLQTFFRCRISCTIFYTVRVIIAMWLVRLTESNSTAFFFANFSGIQHFAILLVYSHNHVMFSTAIRRYIISRTGILWRTQHLECFRWRICFPMTIKPKIKMVYLGTGDVGSFFFYNNNIKTEPLLSWIMPHAITYAFSQDF